MDPSTTRSGKKFSSGQPNSNPDKITKFVSLNINDNDAVSHAEKQAESPHCFSLIADKIYPLLVLDGNNFMAWSHNLFSTWNNYFFDNPNYFEMNTHDSDYRRNLVARIFIHTSFDRSLYKSVTLALVTPNAHTTYQALKKRFCKVSWSSISQHAEILFNPPDRLTTLTSHAVALQHANNNIESQTGAVNSKTILTLSLFFSARQLHESLLNALGSRKAIDPSLEIPAEDLLDIANRMQQHPAFDSSSSITLSRMVANSNMPDHSRQSKLTPKTSCDPSLTPSTPTSSSNSIDRKPEKWKKKWSTAKNPCFYCGQVGNWLPNFPTKAVADWMKHQRQQNVGVASIGAMPLPGCGDAFLDSGATHSIVGNISFFTHLTLYFNHQWFLPIQQSFSFNTSPTIQPITISHPPPVNLSTRPISSDTCSALEDLWHHQIGHLSLQNLQRLRQFDAATGIPPHHLPDVKLCHHCSISKSEHWPVQAPGDLIVADLIGPLPCGIDNKRDILVVQNFFTQLTTPIPISDKAEAKT
ncbi:hypothetical protein O181_016476 [Austropuccinia psidii MF-1]|uniref:GAG-pre-integrase domain-containing protein n=1 Tax=Austropuccinia psidii MF-1 TaxID=1389203 RepID=A0A9Q3C1S2_9BASI|nr:hypothetical protein [Austropuccinia psidii MF-1]